MSAAGAPGLRWLVALGVASAPLAALAQAPAAPRIDTAAVEAAWPKQRLRHLEVGKYPVTWREKLSRSEGLFAGVRFTAPRERDAVWANATAFDDIGRMTPGVTAVRWRTREPGWQVIELDVKVLWKTLMLVFEVEEASPDTLRFRLANRALGEYRGACRFVAARDPASGGPATEVELSTWLKPARPVPLRLLLTVERMMLLSAVREFLTALD